MSQQLKLISFDLCPYVQRAKIILDEKKIEHETIYIDLAKKPDWFHKISPTGKVPVLITEQGTVFESNVICEYLDEITPGTLYPEDSFLKARHKSLIEFGSVILGKISQLYNAKNESQFISIKELLQKDLKIILNDVQGPFFAGKKFQVIDAVYATIFRYLKVFQDDFGFSLLEQSIHQLDWYRELMTKESVRNAIRPNYYARLNDFLKNKQTFISTLSN